MKLAIQIPCYNEEESLPIALRDLPTQIPGIDCIDVIIVDDGSRDRTREVAEAAGVHQVVRLPRNRGLAVAFMAGLEACLRRGADIIVNTDADNQYPAHEIPRLIEPILRGDANMVIGVRDLDKVPGYPRFHKFLQRLGSWFVRRLSGTDIADVTSGFRAYDRETALRVNVFSEFTYTQENIVQAGLTGVRMACITILPRATLRQSRLFKSKSEYVRRSLVTLIRIYTLYRPLQVFGRLGLIVMSLGCLGIVRFLYYFMLLEWKSIPTGHIQSVVLSGVLLLFGFQTLLFGLLADIQSKQRVLLEDLVLQMRRHEYRPVEDQAPVRSSTR